MSQQYITPLIPMVNTTVLVIYIQGHKAHVTTVPHPAFTSTFFNKKTSHRREKENFHIHIVSLCDEQHQGVCVITMTTLAVTEALCSNTETPSVQTHLAGTKIARGKKIYITNQHTQRTPEVIVCVCAAEQSRGTKPSKSSWWNDECVTMSQGPFRLTVRVREGTTDFIIAINRPNEWRWCSHSDALIVVIVLLFRKQHKQSWLLTRNPLMSCRPEICLFNDTFV